LKSPATEADLLDLPEEGRGFELIDGELVEKQGGFRHGRAHFNLSEPPEDEEAVVRVRPDWVCEIISPRKAGNDLIRKKRIYHRNEVPHYWIVDPRDESLTVLQWTAKGYLEILVAQRGERVRAEPFTELELQVGVLFGDDEDETPPAAGTE
jgi:hypothetical protein